MPFTPDDILDAALKVEGEDLKLLLCYASFYQKEYVEPEASQIAAVAQIIARRSSRYFESLNE